MIRYVTVDNLSKSKLNQIISLFKKSYPGDTNKLEKHFSIALKNSKKQIWNIAYFKNKICGAHFLKFKIMNYQGIKLKVCGLSYLAVDKEFQKFNIAKKFINMMFKVSKEHDLILGFARKKLDGYWVPHGFVGVTDFGVFSINTTCIQNHNRRSSVTMHDMKQDNLSKIKELYRINDLFITGNLSRNQTDFKKFMILNPMTQIKIFKKKSFLVGYVVLKNYIIKEIRVDPKFYTECSYSLKKYFISKSIKNIDFNTNLNDPFLLYLSRFSHQISTRYFYEGGHVIRVVNLKKLLNKLKPIIEKKLIKLEINKLSINYEGLYLEFLNRKINFKFLKNIDINLITKLIFGIIPNNNPKLEVLFGNVHIQFPRIDHY